MKTCHACHSIKSLTEFYVNKRALDGHHSVCAECAKAAAKRWYTDNRERALANGAKWKAENREYQRAYDSDRRELRLEQKRDRYWRDHDASLARDAAFRAGHRESVNAITAKWCARNGDKVRAYRQSDHFKMLHAEHQRRRYAAKMATAVEAVSYAAILERYGMVCHICGERIVSRTHLHFDHVVPLALGGPHINGNIRPAHAVCNLKKGARLLEGVA